jgi:Ca2+-binding EF-hand superfamily protein
MWKEEFRALKSYKTESISGDELGALFRAVGYERSDAQTKKYIEYINGVHGGRIELKDFYRYMSTQHDPAQILVKFVHDFDKDKDGYISAEEFKYVLETVEIHDPSVKTGPVSFQDLLREADTNKDGKISIAEMVAWLMSKRT